MANSCQHVSAAKLLAPRLSQQVHREECTQCFDDQVSTWPGFDTPRPILTFCDRTALKVLSSACIASTEAALPKIELMPNCTPIGTITLSACGSSARDAMFKEAIRNRL